MRVSDQPVQQQLQEMGFQHFAVLVGRELRFDLSLRPESAVYLSVLHKRIFWVGESGNLRDRFSKYRRWLALPDDSPRSDVPTRDQLLKLIDRRELVFYFKEPIMIWSKLTSKHYPDHRVEEAILIDYFRPPWNNRPGGKRRG